MRKLAFKIVSVDQEGVMNSPISYSGLAVRYYIGRWAKANTWRYLFVYRTIGDAKKILRKLPKSSNQRLVIIKCEVENLRKAVGGGPVPEYKCTRLKPIRVVE